jgi:hypothetical protein
MFGFLPRFAVVAESRAHGKLFGPEVLVQVGFWEVCGVHESGRSHLVLAASASQRSCPKSPFPLALQVPESTKSQVGCVGGPENRCFLATVLNLDEASAPMGSGVCEIVAPIIAYQQRLTSPARRSRLLEFTPLHNDLM